MRLQDKVGIVTGAANGIGRAITLLFAREGGTVLAVDQDANGLASLEAEARVESLPIETCRIDITSSNGPALIVGRARQTWGRIHFLVNNATWYQTGSIVETSIETWDKTMDVSVRACFLLLKEVLPEMQKAGTGAIVNMASINQMVGSPHLPAYTAAKGALHALTKQVAVDYGMHGIRVNALSPGLIVTDKIRQQLSIEEETIIAEAYPLGRVGVPSDVAQAALFLVSDESSFVTGVDMPVDGGLTALSPAAVIAPRLRAQRGLLPVTHMPSSIHTS